MEAPPQEPSQAILVGIQFLGALLMIGGAYVAKKGLDLADRLRRKYNQEDQDE